MAENHRDGLLSSEGAVTVKILYLTHLSGQLANRLINLAHWFALAGAYDYRVVPCVFGRELDFVGTRKHILSRYVLLHSAAKLARTLNVEEPAPDAALRIVAALESGCAVNINLQGWLPRSLWRELPAAKLRRYFTPTTPHLTRARRAVEQGRGDGSTPLFGVHIRHGDFAEYEGGRWFLPLETINSNLHHVRALNPQARFLVCSDATFSTADFPGSDVTFGPGEAVSDLTALALCDSILKPARSTFALWSAWWGETPCLPMQKVPTFALSDFRVPGLDPFTDGQAD